jgi:hypothetical protein
MIITEPLTPTERRDLKRCEKIIERGQKVFIAVSEALMEIRDKHLYRETYPTFDEYCKEKWGFTARHGQRLLAAKEVADNLRPMGRIPDNERQARPLVGLPAETQREVWQEAIESADNGKITAERVAEVAEPHKTLPPEPVTDTPVEASATSPDWATLLQPMAFYLTDPHAHIVYSTPYFSHWEVERVKPKGMVPQRGAYIIKSAAFKDYRFEKLARVNDSAPEGQPLHADSLDDSTSPDEPTTPRHDPRQVSNAGEWTPSETAYFNRAQAVVNNAHPGKMPYVGKPAAVDELERLHARVLELESENARLVAENMRLRAEVVNLRSLAKLPDVKQPTPERML